MAGNILTWWHGKRQRESTETPETAYSERKSPWSKFDDLPLDEKRKLYKCGTNYVTLKSILTWSEYLQENSYAIYKKKGKTSAETTFEVNKTLNEKISLWQGDITSLEIDAIVNAANNSLLGGGGVDGCIHRAAGSTLRQECAALDGCSTGDAKITSGHKLPAKYVIHTVGPIGKQEKQLRSCYKKCLQLVKKYGLRSVAFCCISTGIYGYPIYDASCVALNTARKWLEHVDDEGNKNADLVDRIIFCVFLGGDLDVYQQLLPRYFPSADRIEQQSDQEQNEESESGEDKNDQHQEEGESQETQGVSGEDKNDEPLEEGESQETQGVSGEDKNDEPLEEGESQETQGVSGEDKNDEPLEEGESQETQGVSGEDKNDEPLEEGESQETQGVSGEDKNDEPLEEGESQETQGVSGEDKNDEPQEEEELQEQKARGASGGEADKNDEQQGGESQQEETEDVEMDEAEIKQGIPDPPKLEELLDSQETDMNVVLEEQINKNAPPEDRDSYETEEIKQAKTDPCGGCTI